jgi:hypothetical protein
VSNVSANATLAVTGAGFEAIYEDSGVSAPTGASGAWRVSIPARSSGAWRVR